MNYKLEIMAVRKNKNKERNISTISIKDFSLKSIIELIASVLAILGVAFGIGYWVACIEHKVDTMNLNQMHNDEMSNLRIQMNSKIQSLQNKYDILEVNYNLLKNRKEENNEN